MRPEALEKLLGSNFALSSNVLWFILTIAIVVFSVFSLVLFFHWQRYGKDALGIAFAEVVYLAGSIFFLLGAAASVILF